MIDRSFRAGSGLVIAGPPGLWRAGKVPASGISINRLLSEAQVLSCGLQQIAVRQVIEIEWDGHHLGGSVPA